jgi:hypothetical protein
MTQPIIYDVHAGFFNHPRAFTEAYTAWLTAHGINKDSTYRTEHYVIDAPLVRVFQFAEDADGRRYYDQVIDDVAKRKPFDVLVKTQPPSPEDYA